MSEAVPASPREWELRSDRRMLWRVGLPAGALFTVFAVVLPIFGELPHGETLGALLVVGATLAIFAAAAGAFWWWSAARTRLVVRHGSVTLSGGWRGEVTVPSSEVESVFVYFGSRYPEFGYFDFPTVELCETSGTCHKRWILLSWKSADVVWESLEAALLRSSGSPGFIGRRTARSSDL